MQTIESTEAELRKLKDQRVEPAAAEAATPKPLTALEQQQKRLEEARERVQTSHQCAVKAEEHDRWSGCSSRHVRGQSWRLSR